MDRVRWFREPVVGVPRLARHFNEFGAPQIRQLTRHDTLREIEQLHQVADTQFARGEQVANAESGGICESAKQRF